MDNINPNLFVIGAPKSGTSAFVDGLAQLDEIFVPKIKEPRFFDAFTYYDDEADYQYKSINSYLELYDFDSSRTSKYRVDGSVFNMYSEKSIKNILSLSPNAKFVLIIRDPISSVKSMFLQRMKHANKEKREISNKFSDCWKSLIQRRNDGDCFPEGCRNKFLFRYDLLYSYELYIPMLKQLISADNLLLIDYRLYKNDPDCFYKHTFDFLQIEGISKPLNKIVNPSIPKVNNILSLSIEKLVIKTSGLRKLIGLNGNKLNFIKLSLSKLFKDENIILDVEDSDIRKEFEKTYEYLNQLDYIQS